MEVDICCADGASFPRPSINAYAGALKGGLLEEALCSAMDVTLDCVSAYAINTPRVSDSGSSCGRGMVPCCCPFPSLLDAAAAPTAAASIGGGGLRDACSPSAAAGRGPPKPGGGGALSRRPAGRSGGGRVVRLLDGSTPRSLVGAVRPFDRVLKTHVLEGGPSVADINAAVRRLEGPAYPWLPAAPEEPAEEPETDDDE
ncbi:hypothetical protein Rsub_05167 [Raphidocelis subcapitata]|uniref:Uncharacterized protein n=1 Tax=Raphidocelis subcapitata TaxID=307507 RepID=A0A2V0P3X6_9CHLO|nr:hypothetical protein Rsub_05167 [Raphidocelis subcapitata]|eukprot:GBF92553.1 hypothetical protein Rsub_05167 [Raphidocelis subcapitata]